VGARTRPDLYDLPSLERMAQRLNWLSVVPVLSHDPYAPGERGGVGDVALRHQAWPDREVYVCGPDAMVSDALTRLVAAGGPLDRIHTEDFGTDPDRAGAVPTASSTMEVPTL